MRRKLKSLRNPHFSVPLENATKIGVLFDASDPSHYVSINHYVSEFKNDGKRVELLGYIPSKHIEGSVSFRYFTKKEVSYFLIPKGNTIEYFITRDFDILLNIFGNQNPILEYISAFSKAKMRIGLFGKGKTDLYDLMVDIKEMETEEIPVDGIIKHFDHYLKMIKENEHTV